MSQMSETADLEAQIEALIKQAGDSLRRHVDDADCVHAGDRVTDLASYRARRISACGNGGGKAATSGRER